MLYREGVQARNPSDPQIHQRCREGRLHQGPGSYNQSRFSFVLTSQLGSRQGFVDSVPHGFWDPTNWLLQPRKKVAIATTSADIIVGTPVWLGFTKYKERYRNEGFLGRMRRCGFPTVTSMGAMEVAEIGDDRLVRPINSNPLLCSPRPVSPFPQSKLNMSITLCPSTLQTIIG